MGLLRVLLALSVILAHLGGIGGYSLAGGLAAVQVFFIISGFYMETVLREKYDPRADLGVFYASRALRIYSVYFTCLAISVVVYAALFLNGGGLFAYIADNAARMGSAAKAWLAFVTLGIFGQDMVLFQKLGEGHFLFNPDGNFGADPGNALAWKFMAIPQAWTISLELMFYALVPFLTRLSTRGLVVLVCASLTLRGGVYATGYDGDPWIYRFFPFELALFVYGMLARRFYDAHIGALSERTRSTIGWGFIAATCLVQTVADALGVPRTLAVWPYYASALIALPCLFSMNTRAATVGQRAPVVSPGQRIDARLAELSCPVYLIHWIVIVAYGAAAPALMPQSWVAALQIPVCVLGALAAGWAIAVCVERPVDRFRHALMQRAPAKRSAITPRRPVEVFGAPLRPAQAVARVAGIPAELHPAPSAE